MSDTVISDVRKVVIDCCRQNGGGHGGSAIGMAAIGTALWGSILRYDPKNPSWFDRDRFVLSNGHASLLQYMMLHMSGYSSITMNDLRGYAAEGIDKPDTECHAHPEIETDGVEITTGPLGQGIANSVGMAIAGKHLAARFNKPDMSVINSHIYCSIGDACLQEGVGLEAASIAGHLKLDNLTVIHDFNGIICDGPLDWVSSEDLCAKMEASGFHIIKVEDGNNDVDAIVAALKEAKTIKGKPTFVSIRTTIGYKTSVQNSAKAHHGNYTDDDAQLYGDSSSGTHHISQSSYDYFKPHVKKNVEEEQQWEKLLEQYCEKYPKLGAQLLRFRDGKFAYDPSVLEGKAEALDGLKVNPTKLSGVIADKLFASTPGIMAGGADLWGATKLQQQENITFGPGNYAGTIVRYGVREHAMCAISNGISAYQPGAFMPIDNTFLMFYLYGAPAVRMGALCQLPGIHLASHDSINEGQNGPTHQPIEVDSLFRAVPNLLFIRPCTHEEVYGAYKVALDQTKTPSIISLSRESISDVPNTDRNKVAKGGYVVIDNDRAKLTLVSTGVELGIAYLAVKQLQSKGIEARLVSMPCIELFERQPQEYQDEVLKTDLIVSIEPYRATYWARLCTASIDVHSWGCSASAAANYKRKGLDVDTVVSKLEKYVANPSRRFTVL